MRIAIVVQRYGEEINGGAEYFCRKLAEALANEDEVDVLTTCALDYMTWLNHYEPGETLLNNVTIKRFPVEKRRVRLFNFVYRLLNSTHTWKTQKKAVFDSTVANLIESVRRVVKCIWLFIYFNLGIHFILERLWMYLQGPRSAQLKEYLQKHGPHYDVVLFKTFGYGTTYYNFADLRANSCLVPTAHSNELNMHFRIFNKVFKNVRCLAFLTPEEQVAVHKQFPDSRNQLQKVVGFGIDPDMNGNADRFRKKFGVVGDFVLYLGRVSAAKGCEGLFNLFKEHKIGKELGVKLVTIGKSEIRLPSGNEFVHLGFVSEEDKYDALAAANVLVVPSKYESLSIVMLESWLVGTPVIVNEECDVIVGQCERSRGGISYYGKNLKDNLKTLVDDVELAKQMGQNGRRYVLDNYSWEHVLGIYRKIFKSIKH